MSTSTPNFDGLRVASFESRRAEEMARLIEKLGGLPFVSPSLREVPIERNAAAIDFANRVMTGQIDLVIFTTGVGFRHLIATLEKQVDLQRFLDALRDMPTLARGPKPVAAMKELGLTPTYRAAEPNTWREILAVLDQNVKLANQTIGVQEYGQPNPSLVAGLEARGARVESLRIYRWALPDDVGPLAANIKRLAAREIDVALFTSAHQVVNLLRMAEEMQLAAQCRAGLMNAVIASIGPTTSEALREQDLPVDLEPEQGKMGQLVVAAAEKSGTILARKRRFATVAPSSPPAAPLAAVDPAAPWYQSPFLRACRREPTRVTPIWLMRQAGRYMAEYREVRGKMTFLELCKNPQLCAEVMITAVEKLQVDAAIIFSDLLPILEPMGMQLEFVRGDGPVIHNPIRDPSEVGRLRELTDLGTLEFVFETVRQTRAALAPHLPLIGFGGAPFTLASYAIEGGGSRNYVETKGLMYRDPGAWRALMETLTRAVTAYLNAQIAAGCQCVQIFDSWVGCLGPDDYRRHVLPHMQRLFAGLTPGVPTIHFAAGNPALLPLAAEGGGSVIGLDWRGRLADGWQAVGYDRAVQGNLDPGVLLSDRAEIRRRAQEILDQAAGRPGHIFNLGHGVHQQTPVDNARALVDAVRELSAR